VPVGLNLIQREAWNTAQSTEDPREKIQALSLAKECYAMKMELLTNATVIVDDAIRFVSSNITNKQGIIANTDMDDIHNHGSEEYEVERDDLPQGKEAINACNTTSTTNQVF